MHWPILVLFSLKSFLQCPEFHSLGLFFSSMAGQIEALSGHLQMRLKKTPLVHLLQELVMAWMGYWLMVQQIRHLPFPSPTPRPLPFPAPLPLPPVQLDFFVFGWAESRYPLHYQHCLGHSWNQPEKRRSLKIRRRAFIQWVKTNGHRNNCYFFNIAFDEAYLSVLHLCTDK